jgi:hypothetical protein
LGKKQRKKCAIRNFLSSLGYAGFAALPPLDVLWHSGDMTTNPDLNLFPIRF